MNLLVKNRAPKSRSGSERVTRKFPDKLFVRANGALRIILLFRFLSDRKKLGRVAA